MAFLKKLAHLTLPGYSNDHKAKLLHNSSLALILCFVFTFQFLINSLAKTNIGVLGYAANISTSEIVQLTNQKRSDAGVGSLALNQQLSDAARKKGEDMLAQNYWAHVAPDGTQPWKFFVDAGYKYKYAGENLARDFSNASSAVDAWMASPSHKDNLLSSKYTEIGIAVVEGDLDGVDTTIIVQLFGARQNALATVAEVSAVSASDKEPVEILPTVTTSPVPTEAQKIADTRQSVSSTNSPAVSTQIKSSSYWLPPFESTRLMSISITGLLILLFAADTIFVNKNRIPRKTGRTLAHLAFLGMVFSLILIVKAGTIL